MTTRVILSCAGDGSRWNNYLGVPKQLAPVDGEPVLHRTVRLFAERGADVWIVARDHDPRWQVPGARTRVVEPNPADGDMGRYTATRDLWLDDGRTIVLFGDVFFTEDAADTIVGHDVRDWTWFARFSPNDYTGNSHPEGFGCSFYPEHIAEHEAAIRRLVHLHWNGWPHKIIGWTHYLAMLGRDDNQLRVRRTGLPNGGRAVHIHDWTDDFDWPKTYDEFMRRRRRWARRKRSIAEARVSVLVPWRSGDPHREAAWSWVKEQYAAVHPEWEIVVGTDDGAGPWRKGAAFADALGRAAGDVIVAVDADTWTERLADGVRALGAGAPWVLPHDRYVRFTLEATEQILRGAEPSALDLEANHDEKPYTQKAAGSASILWRDDAEDIPIDTRFAGWGGEDHAWMWALDTLVGTRTRLAGSVWHLWHPPQERPGRREGSPETMDLRARYRQARGDERKMRRLVETAKAGTGPPGIVLRHRRTGETLNFPDGSRKARRLEASRRWARIDDEAVPA